MSAERLEGAGSPRYATATTLEDVTLFHQLLTLAAKAATDEKFAVSWMPLRCRVE